ncbi:DUF1697 domain-containing protein [Devosia rhodophyticola]|uniref:DUF1697 domain-containing protein n=1 Tax=Devosia rhodophyticola TaxID=3026423 RepID=A0ABY7Z240_9HYPH|nr:DUF1697 domain-containing protein [Devosia rhodophyticola]WDR07270.1 DUF1697 domain-containing protein [Devosia rhodophyticola]
MTRHIAWLRGVNLGKRQVRSADLRQAFTDLGYDNVKTLLASGNVLFDADIIDRHRIESGLEKAFGFPIPVVLRSQAQLQETVGSDPFRGLAADKDTKFYVTFLADPVAKSLPMPCEVPGDFRVVHLTDTEIFIIAHRMPSGRFGAGMDQIHQFFGKQHLWTSRNWNTVLKAL